MRRRETGSFRASPNASAPAWNAGPPRVQPEATFAQSARNAYTPAWKNVPRFGSRGTRYGPKRLCRRRRSFAASWTRARYASSQPSPHITSRASRDTCGTTTSGKTSSEDSMPSRSSRSISGGSQPKRATPIHLLTWSVTTLLAGSGTHRSMAPSSASAVVTSSSTSAVDEHAPPAPTPTHTGQESGAAGIVRADVKTTGPTTHSSRTGRAHGCFSARTRVARKCSSGADKHDAVKGTG